MFITPILYIILGISLGFGSALIFLQERFTKERRKLIALNEAEKVKSADMLKSLDTKWEEKTKDEIEKKTVEQAIKVKELEEALILTENKSVEPSDVKETELEDLMSEKRQLHETLQSAQQEVEDLHGEIAFLKGEIQSLEAAKKNQPTDDDFLVLGPGNHYIPGSVARNLMKKRNG